MLTGTLKDPNPNIPKTLNTLLALNTLSTINAALSPKDPSPPHTGILLGGSWDLVSKVISTLCGVISIVTLIITLVTKSHDPLSGSPRTETSEARRDLAGDSLP